MKQYLKLDYDMIIDKNLSSNEFRIMCYLLRYINKETGESFPSIEKIAEDTGISSATIKRSIKRLSQQEYFIVNTRKGQAGKHNIYSNFKYDLREDNSSNVIDFGYRKGNYTSNNSKRVKEINAKSFNNFEARGYDYDELERQLLGWD